MNEEIPVNSSNEEYRPLDEKLAKAENLQQNNAQDKENKNTNNLPVNEYQLKVQVEGQEDKNLVLRFELPDDSEISEIHLTNLGEGTKIEGAEPQPDGSVYLSIEDITDFSLILPPKVDIDNIIDISIPSTIGQSDDYAEVIIGSESVESQIFQVLPPVNGGITPIFHPYNPYGHNNNLNNYANLNIGQNSGPVNQNLGPTVSTLFGVTQGQTDEDSTQTVQGSLQIHTINLIYGAKPPTFSANTFQGTYGTLKVNVNGQWTYDLDNTAHNVQALTEGQAVQEKFTISSTDGKAIPVTIDITGKNDAAQIGGSAMGLVTEESMLQASGQLTISDVDTGQDHFQAETIHGTYGDAVIDSSGKLVYTLHNTAQNVQELVAGQAVHDTITIKSADGTSHDVTMTVHGTNDNPVLSAITAQSATEDGSSVTGSITSTDVDKGDTTVFTTSANTAGFTLNRDGSYTLDPTDAAYQHLAAGEHQTLIIPVTVTDSNGATDTQNLLITVNGTNDTPTVSAPVTLPAGTEDKTQTITTAQLLATATDVDTTDTLSIANLAVDHGTITGPDSSGNIHFTPGANYNGKVTFTYDVTDSHGGTVHTSASTDLSAVQDSAQIAGVDTGDVTENTAGVNMSPDYSHPGIATLTREPLYADGKLTITDPDSGEETFETKGVNYNYSGKYGDLLLQKDGTWHYIADAGDIRIRGGHNTTRGTAIDHLGEGQTLTDTITVYSKDGTPHDIVITIHGSNDRPYCSSEVVLQSGREDILQTFTNAQLLANTVDVDANDAGKLSINNLHADHGSIKHNTDGTYTFTPERNYNGTVHFSYDVKDAHGGVTHTGAITSLSAVGDAATITGTDATDVTEDSIFGMQWLLTWGKLNVTDPDAGEEKFDSVYPAKNYQGIGYTTQHGGHVLLEANGTWRYQMDNNKSEIQQLNVGDTLVDKVTIHTVDGTTHDIQVTIHGTNDKPTLQSQTQSVTEDGSQLNGHMQATDVDKGDSASFATSANTAGFTLNSDGSYNFDPTDAAYQHLAAGEHQTLTIPVTVTDSQGATDTQNLVIRVNGTNDDPVVSAPVNLPSGKEDISQTITTSQLLATATDIDKTDTLSVVSLAVDHGTVSGPDSAGNIHFTPEENYNGKVTFTYDVTDSHGGTVHTSASTDLSAVQDSAQIAGVDTGDVTENTAGVNMSPDYSHPGIATLTREPLYADGKLTITDPDSGEETFETKGVNYNYSGKYGDLLLQKDGTWHYIADAGDIRIRGGHNTTRGTAIDHLGEGQTLTDTITVYSKDGTPHDIVITIHGSNDRPYCSSEVVLQSGREDILQTFTNAQLLANTVDVDANDAGLLTIDNLHANHGSINLNQDGSFSFTPEKDYNGEVHFSYDVKDAHGGVTHTGATTTLAAVNDNPDVSPITDSVKESASNHHSLDLLVGATDKEGDQLIVNQLVYSVDGSPSTTQIPAGLVLAADGHTIIVDATNSSYEHLANGQLMKIAISYLVDDGHGGQSHQTADLTIQGTDDKATLVSNVIQLTETQAVDSQQHTYKGTLQLIDPDSGDNTQFEFGSTYLGQGFAPGNLTVWPDGSYQFRLQAATNRHADDLVTSLRTGESMEIPYEIKTNDGQTLTIMVKVIGEDNQARIEVGRYSSFDNHAYEDNIAPGNTPNEIWSGGNLRVIDPDHDQAGFIAQSITTSEGGNFYINARGTWAYTIDNLKLQHMGAGETFQKTFTVESIDGSAHQDITVTVHGTNDAPVVSAEVRLASGTEDINIQLSTQELLTNASDIDHNDIGQLSIANLVADHGVIIDNKDGTFTLQQEKDYNGQVHLSYDVKDAHGGVTHTGATTELSATNDASSLAPALATNEVIEEHTKSAGSDELWSGWTNLDIKDVDGAGEAKVVAIEVNGVRHTVPVDFAMKLQAAHGTFSTTHSTDGHNKWSYTADNRHSEIQGLKDGDSLTDHMTLITADGTRIPISASIKGQDDHVVIDTPDKMHGNLGTVTEDTHTSISGVLQAHDLDTTDSISFRPQHISDQYGTFTVAVDGHWTYVLDSAKTNLLTARDHVAHALSIEAVSTDGSTVHQQIEVIIQGTSDRASITSSSIGQINEDSNQPHIFNHNVFEVASGSLNIIDPDKGENHFQYSQFGEHAVSDPFGGHLRLSSNGFWNYEVSNAALQHLAEGETTQVIYQVRSADGTAYNLAINVVGKNDAPTVTTTSLTATEDVNHTFTAAEFGFSDVDTKDTLDHVTITDLPDPSQGVLLLNGHVLSTGQDIAQADIQQLVFTPFPNFNGDVHFKYTVNDGHTDSAEATGTLVVANVNDRPNVIAAVSGSKNEDSGMGAVNLLVGATDADSGDTLTVDNVEYQFGSNAKSSTIPSFLTLGKDGHTLVINSNAQEFQHLAIGDSETITVNFNVEDGHGGVTPQTATITVQGTNDSPEVSIAVADQTVGELQPLSFQVPSGTFTDVDHGDSLGYSATLGDGSALPTWLHFDASTATFSGTPPHHAVGDIDVKVTAIDGSNESISDTFTLKVSDTTPPPTPTVQLSHDTGSSSNDLISTDGSLIIGQQEVAATLQYSIDGHHWTSTFTPKEGANTVFVKQVDSAGNESTSSAPLHFTLDNTVSAPTVTLTHDTRLNTARVPLGDHITSDGRLSIQAENGASIEYSIDGGQTWQSSFGASEGSNHLQVRQVDAAGNTSASTSFSFKLDTIIGNVSLNPVDNDDIINAHENQQNLVISGTSTNIEPGDILVVKIGQHYLETHTAVDGSWSVSLAPADFHKWTPTDGSYNVKVAVMDIAGNIRPDVTHPFTLDTTPPGAPSVNIFSHPSPDGMVTVTGTAISGNEVVIKDGSTVLGTTIADSQGHFSFPVPNTLTHGPHLILASQTDHAGNPSPDSPFRPIIVDTHTQPSLSIDDISNALDVETSGSSMHGANAVGFNANGFETSSGDVTINGSVVGVLDGTSMTIHFVDSQHPSDNFDIQTTVISGKWSSQIAGTQMADLATAHNWTVTAEGLDKFGHAVSTTSTVTDTNTLEMTVNEDSTGQLDLLNGADGQSVNNIEFSTDGQTYSSHLPPGFTLDPDGHSLHLDTSTPDYQHLGIGQNIHLHVRYQIEQGSSTTTEHINQTAEVTITGTADAPVLHSISDSGQQHSGSIEGNVITGIGTNQGHAGLATDLDANHSLELSNIQIHDTTAHQYVSVTPGHSHTISGVGTLEVEADGHYKFTPDPNFTGKVPSMVYAVTDKGSGPHPSGEFSQNSLEINVSPDQTPGVVGSSGGSQGHATIHGAIAASGPQAPTIQAQHLQGHNALTIQSTDHNGGFTLNPHGGASVRSAYGTAYIDSHTGHVTFQPVGTGNPHTVHHGNFDVYQHGELIAHIDVSSYNHNHQPTTIEVTPVIKLHDPVQFDEEQTSIDHSYIANVQVKEDETHESILQPSLLHEENNSHESSDLVSPTSSSSSDINTSMLTARHEDQVIVPEYNDPLHSFMNVVHEVDHSAKVNSPHDVDTFMAQVDTDHQSGSNHEVSDVDSFTQDMDLHTPDHQDEVTKQALENLDENQVHDPFETPLHDDSSQDLHNVDVADDEHHHSQDEHHQDDHNSLDDLLDDDLLDDHSI